MYFIDKNRLCHILSIVWLTYANYFKGCLFYSSLPSLEDREVTTLCPMHKLNCLGVFLVQIWAKNNINDDKSTQYIYYHNQNIYVNCFKGCLIYSLLPLVEYRPVTTFCSMYKLKCQVFWGYTFGLKLI